jgi:fructokinase
VFVDVNLRSPWWEKQTALDLLQQATWLKLNQQELEALTASTGELEKQAQDLLAASDAEIVFVTLGGEGAKAWTKNGQQAIAQPMGDIAIVDTVGAGDAFSAVLMLGLAQQWPLQVMLDRAQAFATTIISLRGAISQDPILYQDVIEQWS